MEKKKKTQPSQPCQMAYSPGKQLELTWIVVSKREFIQVYLPFVILPQQTISNLNSGSLVQF